MKFLVIILLIIIITKYIEYKLKNNKKYTFNGKLNKQVLTNTELLFFNKLKEITDKNNLYIFTKIRIADLIETKSVSDFNKIKSKHIDFIITDNKTQPLLYIELDDKSHNKNTTKQNDNKKDIIFNNVNNNIIRVKTNEIDKKLPYIESLLINKLGV